MAGTRIRLPHYDMLPEGVYLHQEDPADRRIVLQVPNEDRSDSETYIVDLEDTIHSTWLEGLKNSRNLVTTLGWSKHIAYCPSTGHFEEMADLDEPSLVAMRVVAARQDASFEQTNDRQVAARRRRSVPGISKLRMALSGRRGIRR